MKRRRTLSMLAILGMALLGAQDSGSRKAQSLMQSAQAKETISGDLKSAISLYRQAAREAGKDRSLAAQAMLRVAACQEKLGAAEARKTYEEIVRNYADQKEAVAVARQKLGGAAHAAGMVVRKVWDGPGFGQAGNLTPDGRFWAYREQYGSRLVQFDLETNGGTTLFEGEGWRPLYSPDGKRVVFGALQAGGGYQLAWKNTGTGGAPVIKRIPFSVWSPLDWFPDSQQLLVMGTQDFQAMDLVLAAVNVDNGETKELCKIAQSQRLNDLTGLVSPDGRWVVFEAKSRAGASDRDILIVSASGGEPQPLIQGPAEDVAVAFTPDGAHLLYHSNSGAGAEGLYAVKFSGGRVTGDALLVSTTLPARRGYFDRKGAFYYSLQSGGERQPYVVELDPVTGRAQSQPRQIPMRRGSGEGKVNWAGDSKTVILHRFGAGRMIEVAMVNADTGRELHALQTDLPVVYGAYLRPDGSAVFGVPTRPPGQYVDVDWRGGMVKKGSLTEGKLPESVCGGPTTFTQTDPAGVRVTDYGTNRHWLVQARTDLERSSTIADVSADCRQMVVLKTRGPAIAHVDLVGGTERELVRVPQGYKGVTFPRLTPDGKRVVFVATKEETRNRELWSVPVEGGAASPTGAILANMRDPKFSPDGRRLLLDGGQYMFEAYKVENLLPASLRSSR